MYNYYPYGYEQSERVGSNEEYRYSFNGMEKDVAIAGDRSILNTEFREMDTKIGRWWSLDPLKMKFPNESHYSSMSNNPIRYIDHDGLQPSQPGSYDGEGGIAPVKDNNGNKIEGTENQRWSWSNSTWKSANFGITNNELTSLFPKGSAGLLKTVETTLNLEGASFGISSQTELNGFVSQTGFETQGFTKLSEDVHRYTLSNLRGFKRMQKYSDEYLKNVMKDPNELAVLLYKGSGNGIDYRGRGLIHTTWESNYKTASTQYNSRYGTSYDFTKTPELLATDNQIAARSALIFFKTNGLFDMQNFDFNAVSMKVNKYDIQSFPKRNALFQKINSVVK